MIEAGSGFIISEGGCEIPIKQGAMLFIDEALHCAIRTSSAPMKVKKIACDTEMSPNLMDYFKRGRLLIADSCSPEARRLYMELFNKSRGSAVSENKLVSLMLYRLLIVLGQEIFDRRDNENSVLEEMAENYKEYMFARYKAGDSFEALPETEAVFRRLYGKSAEEYNTFMRLERSKPYVAFGRDFGEAAMFLGFKNEADFVRRFREEYKLYPHEYKALYK